ncbi:MAG: hypothetical protein MJB14_07790 [Spirochaetes bacterium]|nr:hypothetical protein [Spirochaetota bacterium]
MEYYEYFLQFPEGDTQPVNHSLNMGDIVDINGNVYHASNLSPQQIAYQVVGVKKNYHFKEVKIVYKLKLMNRNEVEDEKSFLDFKNQNSKNKAVFDKLSKKAAKKRFG